MQFNFDYEIAALLFMAVILLHFVFVRQFPGSKMSIFRLLLISCSAQCVVNIASSIGLANPNLVPELVNEVFAFAFFALEGLSSFLIFLYFITVGEFSGRAKRGVLVFGILPFILFETMVILTPFYGFFYYFRDNVYYPGFGSCFGFFYMIYYFLLDIILVFWKRKEVGFRNLIIVPVYTASAILTILIQYKFREILLTGMGNAIMIMMIYLAMQNFGELLDSVTGIGNESAFMLQLKNILGHKAPAVVITIDIRQSHYTKTVLGYENCNQILRDVGSYLYQLGGRFHVFHNSGDIFTVLADSGEKGQKLLEKIRDRMQKEWTVQQNHVVLNAVMAVMHYPEDFTSIPDFVGMREYLLEIARIADYQAAIEADEIFIKSYQRRIAVELAVERAIREHSFEVYYQPIYAGGDHRINSLEALVRLLDKKLGFIPPDEFIPIAEKNGSIVRIGNQVLEEGCRFLAKHVLSNPSLGIETIHVNISAASCLRQNLAEMILPVLEKYHIPPSMITLMVAERTAIGAPELMRKHVKELGELGIGLIIKGFEKKEQGDIIERLGADCIQGNYYGHPLPEKECIRHIRSYNLDSEDYGK